MRQEVAGKERDYFLLEYSGGDKLFVPLEQVDRITRYVGPDGSERRASRVLTPRTGARATGKARKNGVVVSPSTSSTSTRVVPSAQGFALRRQTRP